MTTTPPHASERERRRTERLAQLRRRRLLALGALLAAFGFVIAIIIGSLSSGGSKHESSNASHGAGSSSAPTPKPSKPVASELPNRLPAPVSGEALVAQPGGLLVIGGLNGSGASTGGVFQLAVASGKVSPVGSLSGPLHDAAATTLSGQVFVFGGGSSVATAAVQRLGPGGSAKLVGHLPLPVSDLAAVNLGGAAYVLAGYDGGTTVGSVLRTSNGRLFTKIAELQTPVRYSAVATAGNTIYALGGELADGSDTRAIQAIDVATGQVRTVGQLKQPLSHASAVTLGDRIYVLGGRTRGSATDRIVSFDPSNGKVARAGHLPMPVTNAAAIAVGESGYLVGGLGPNGKPLASIVTVKLGR